MSRLGSINEEELQEIIHQKHSKNTHKATKVAWAFFETNVREKKLNINTATISKIALDDILVKFYVELRKQDGNFYTKSSFRAIRNGVQRKFKELQEIDIIDDPAFTRSENVFRAQCVQLKKMGLAKVEHKPPITPTDI